MQKKGKRVEKNELDDDSESEDITDDIMAMATTANKGKKKAKTGMSAFQMLGVEDSDVSEVRFIMFSKKWVNQSVYDLVVAR